MGNRRYHTLDGMRGVAALIVVAGHGTGWFRPLPAAHFWLAVDLFFVISGFVLAKVYEPRFAAGLSSWAFMKQRYIRLYPLYFIGIVIGILSGLGTLVSGHGNLTPFAFTVATVSGVLLVPSITGGTHSEVIPLNAPGWSLVFELISNIIYSVLWRWMTSTVVLILAAVSAGVLICEYAHGYPLGGTTLGLLWLGFPRVGFSFFIGVLIARYLPERSIRSEWSWAVIASLLPLLYWIAKLGEVADPVIQLAVMPSLVAIGASIEPRSSRVMAVLGAVSYPIYAVHVPLISLANRVAFVAGLKPGVGAPYTGVAFLCFLSFVAVTLDRYYDNIVRNWLTFRFSTKQSTDVIETATPL